MKEAIKIIELDIESLKERKEDFIANIYSTCKSHLRKLKSNQIIKIGYRLEAIDNKIDALESLLTSLKT